MQNFLSLWLNAGAQITHGGQVQRPRQKKEEQRALKQHNRDRTVIVLPADKGRVTVVLDRQDYVDKAKTHLGDTTAYVLLDHHPLPSSVNGLRKVVDRLRRQGKLSPSDIRQIRPTDAAVARFYGLPSSQTGFSSSPECFATTYSYVWIGWMDAQAAGRTHRRITNHSEIPSRVHQLQRRTFNS